MTPHFPARLIEYMDYDIVIPFVCRRCGRCCRSYYPKIDFDMLPEIERIIRMPIPAIQSRLHQDCVSHSAGNPTDCFFLDSIHHSCLIHSIKPDPCRSFPALTDGGAGQVDCPAHQEYKDVLKGFSVSGKHVAVQNLTSARKLRPIPDREWHMVLEQIKKDNVSADYLQTFRVMNRRP